MEAANIGSGQLNGIRVTNSISGTYMITSPGAISIGTLSTFIHGSEWTRYSALPTAGEYKVRARGRTMHLNKGNSIKLKPM